MFHSTSLSPDSHKHRQTERSAGIISFPVLIRYAVLYFFFSDGVNARTGALKPKQQILQAMHYNVRVARRATTTTTSTVSTGPRPPALSVGVFGLLTFEGDGAALVGSSDGYVTRVSLSTLNSVNEMLRDRHKVRFELSVENRHKIVMLGENKKFALEKHHQGDRRFKMALIDNDDYVR
eukprot:GHVN01031903.1.p2 GENE.GHVN01031903.1~~GHVN01031903.1.p2  ORF type:complete len:179 (+),score=29.21 GHVN01031903.1:64-600(+)